MRHWLTLGLLCSIPLASCGDDDSGSEGAAGKAAMGGEARAGAASSAAASAGAGDTALGGQSQGGESPATGATGPGGGGAPSSGAGGSQEMGGAGEEPGGGGSPGGPAATVEVTPAGATIQLEGVTVTIPSGALAAPTTITVQLIAPESVAPLPNDFSAAGPTVRLLPHGLTFTKAVSIAIPHDSATTNNLEVVRIDNDDDTTWEELEGVAFAATMATFNTNRFCAVRPVARVEFRSCHELPPNCGPSQDESCCATLPVAAGSFGQGEPDKFESQVSGFRLDKYEVTVGRFRTFVASYDAWRGSGRPRDDAGRHPNVELSGWLGTFSDELPVDAEELANIVSCDIGYPSYWDPREDDTLPMNCVNWYESFAFCIWDGGRLPTEAEWEYAAAGGAADRIYPWGNTPLSNLPDGTREMANYHCLGAGNTIDQCTREDILPVGSKPAGVGLYGQHDLAGSMWEWNFDAWTTSGYPTTPTSDYATLFGTYRVLRGGSWQGQTDSLQVAPVDPQLPTHRYHYTGFRCARN